jgi:hypothetical protein
MELSFVSLILIAVVVPTYAAIVVLSASIAHASTPLRPRSESILIGFLVLVLILWIQIHLLSLLPVERPLRYLWVVHALCLAGLCFSCIKLGTKPLCWTMQLFSDTWSAGARLPRLHLLFSIVVVVYLVLHAAFAFSFNNYDWDGLDYHIPMAIQPYQDGRLGTLGADIPWIDHYPRGIALLWFHTIQLTHSNALFLLVQWSSGLMLALAAFAMLRRQGIGRQSAGIAACIILSMPVFSLFSASLYIDLPTALAAILPVLFLTPKGPRNTIHANDVLWAMIAYAVAIQVKLPIIPTIFILLAAVYWIVLAGPNGRASLKAFVFSWRAPLAVIMACAAAYPYFANLIQFSNPLYPLDVQLPGGIHLQGPLASGVYELYAQSRFGTMAELGRWGRFPAAWLDLFQRRGVDAFGLNGPVFGLFVLPLFIAFLFAAIRSRAAWQLSFALMALSVFAIGSLALPRYHIPMTVLAVCGAVIWMASLNARHRATLQAVAMFLCMFSVFHSLNFIHHVASWKLQVMGDDYRFMQRAAALPERNPYGYNMYASPQMTTAIRRFSEKGDTLAWNVRTYIALLWNTSYSNRLVHVPASPHEFFPGNASNFPPVTEQALQQWMHQITSLMPDQILVYSDSVYATSLLAAHADSYKVAYADPHSSDRVPMTLFQKRAD